MNKTKVKKPSLEDLFNEIKALRRDVSIFIPTESFSDYKNKTEVVVAYREVLRQIARAR